MIAKHFLILAIIAIAIVSHHGSKGHVIGLDHIKHKGIEAITAVKLASDKFSSVAAVPIDSLKHKALLAVKVPIALAKQKLAAGLALKKAKIIAPIILFKAAKQAIGAKIATKKLKLAALGVALKKKIALAKLLKLAKIPFLLWKIKGPFIAAKTAIKALHAKKAVAWEGLENAAKITAVQKVGTKAALLSKLPLKPLSSLPLSVPILGKGPDIGLSSLLSGAVPLIGSAVNKNIKIPDVLYQLVPDYATQFKNVKIIPSKSISITHTETETNDASTSSSSDSFEDLSETFEPPSEPIVEEHELPGAAVYGLPSETLSLPYH